MGTYGNGRMDHGAHPRSVPDTLVGIYRVNRDRFPYLAIEALYGRRRQRGKDRSRQPGYEATSGEDDGVEQE